MKKCMMIFILIGFTSLFVACPPPAADLYFEFYFNEQRSVEENASSTTSWKDAKGKRVSVVTHENFKTFTMPISDSFGNELDFNTIIPILKGDEEMRFTKMWKEWIHNLGFLYSPVESDKMTIHRYVGVTTKFPTCKVEPVRRDAKPSLIYMVADNDLYRNAIADIKEMEKNFFGYDTYIYLDVPDNSFFGKPVILQLTRDLNDDDDSQRLASSVFYQFSSTVDSFDLEHIRFDVFLTVGEGTKDFDLVLFWSHGTDWLPKGVDPDNVYTTSSFGVDKSNGTTLEIKNLADIFSPNGFNYSANLLAFDCCSMGSVEAASYFAQCNIAQVLAPTTAIMAEGFDYSAFFNVLNSATATTSSLGKLPSIIDAVVDNYKDSSMLGVVGYNVANFKPLMVLFKEHFTPTITDFSTLRNECVARYTSNDPNQLVLFYDFKSFMEKSGSSVPQEIAALFSSESFYSKSKNVSDGMNIDWLSCYIPYSGTSEFFTNLNNAFKETPWYKESNFGEKFSF